MTATKTTLRRNRRRRKRRCDEIDCDKNNIAKKLTFLQRCTHAKLWTGCIRTYLGTAISILLELSFRIFNIKWQRVPAWATFANDYITFCYRSQRLDRPFHVNWFWSFCSFTLTAKPVSNIDPQLRKWSSTKVVQGISVKGHIEKLEKTNLARGQFHQLI